ncbi:hypothetical protein P170DRAFT_465017 [Aspergillus steynii IBT 23096]|uniref:Uncharacterized protein n=1 Tax=Aspergillus steynii IBT 23096 TaxID=1392250 RepID=A0A2I2G9T8_9EURO|nr:uncharacterized protein P170DRAFT_465017 [Aspergillus steynii IBT 23096]PLB49647.1 hypothetical protein P170DRAFT_465017 [Aspergillus steynii IBT 23096]
MTSNNSTEWVERNEPCHTTPDYLLTKPIYLMTSACAECFHCCRRYMVEPLVPFFSRHFSNSNVIVIKIHYGEEAEDEHLPYVQEVEDELDAMWVENFQGMVENEDEGGQDDLDLDLDYVDDLDYDIDGCDSEVSVSDDYDTDDSDETIDLEIEAELDLEDLELEMQLDREMAMEG